MEHCKEGMVIHVFGRGINREAIMKIGFGSPMIVHTTSKDVRRELRDLPITFSTQTYRPPRSEAIRRSMADLVLRPMLEALVANGELDPKQVNTVIRVVENYFNVSGGKDLLLAQYKRWSNRQCSDVIAEFDQFCANVGLVIGRTNGAVEARIYKHLKAKYAHYRATRNDPVAAIRDSERINYVRDDGYEYRSDRYDD